MLNRKYVVCRDDIYVGEVITPIEIFRYEGSSNLCRIKPGQLRPGFYEHSREQS